MKKIMFHLNCLEQGGAERVVSNLANQFSKEGIEVIVTTQWQGENEFKLEDKVRRIHVGLKKEDENKNRISKALLRVKYLKDCIKEEKPDAVIAFTRKAIYRTLQAAYNIKVPVIIAVRTNPVGHYDFLTDKFFIPLLFRRANGSVFQTEGQKEFFPKRIQDMSEIILNPVNDKYINAPLPKEKEKSIVQAGRIVDFKNQPMLIDAFMMVHEKYPEYQLKIYGADSFDGTWQILENKITEYQASEFIHLMGGSDELEKEIPKSEIYAFSSDWEGLPNALLEAMAMGMPIVSTDCPCGGPRTVMTDGIDGLLVPIKDKDAMAEGLLRLIEDKELAEKLGNNARKIVDKINGPAIISKWREYIDKVIDNYGN